MGRTTHRILLADRAGPLSSLSALADEGRMRELLRVDFQGSENKSEAFLGFSTKQSWKASLPHQIPGL